MLRQEVFLQIQIVLGFLKSFLHFSFVVFPTCLCSEGSLLPLPVHVILVLQGLVILRLLIHIQPGKKLLTTALISHPLLETQPFSFPFHKPHFAFSMPVTSHSYSVFFQRLFKGSKLPLPVHWFWLCNLLAKAPFQTEMRVVRPKMSSLITDIHCWHLSSVCQDWRRKKMVFREPEIQESVTLKPTAECNVLMPGWNSWQFT